MSSLPLFASDAPSLVVRYDDAVPVVEIAPSPNFDALRAWLRDQVPLKVDQIGGRSVRLDLGSRDIQLFDLRRLIHLLRDEFSIEVTGLYVTPTAVQRYAERELKLKLFSRERLDLQPQDLDDEGTTECLQPQDVLDAPDLTGLTAAKPGAPSLQPADLQPQDLQQQATDDSGVLDDSDLIDASEADDHSADDEPAIQSAPRVLPTDLQPQDLEEEPAPGVAMSPERNAADQGRRTLPVKRTLRSGATVQFEGDVIVYGDLNPGAQVIAAGNVIVLGALKGMVHAGASGDEAAFIMALDLKPTQLRIGRKIAIAPTHRGEGWQPELANVVDGQIVIEPYRGRVR